MEVVQKEDSLVSIDFSSTVDLLVESDHILVLIESNMNSMLDSYWLFIYFQTADSKSRHGNMKWTWKHFLVESAKDSSRLVTLNFAFVDFEFDESAIEYVLIQGFTDRSKTLLTMKQFFIMINPYSCCWR